MYAVIFANTFVSKTMLWVRNDLALKNKNSLAVSSCIFDLFSTFKLKFIEIVNHVMRCSGLKNSNSVFTPKSLYKYLYDFGSSISRLIAHYPYQIGNKCMICFTSNTTVRILLQSLCSHLHIDSNNFTLCNFLRCYW